MMLELPTQPARPRIVIAGVGLVSPLGHNAWQTFAALLAGRTIANRCAQMPDGIDPVAFVRAVGGVSTVQHAAIDPAIDLAELAAREALFEARAVPDNLPCYIGTSKGAVTAMSRFAGGEEHLAKAVAMGPCGLLTSALAERLHVAPAGHYVAACASSLYALHAARQAMLRDDLPAALVVTSESAMLPMFVHSYRRLGVLAPTRPDTYRARPLNNQREGFMLAELGAAVLLKRVDESSVQDARGRGDIELLDTATACEGFDLVRPSPTMAALRHVAARLFAPRRIDVLHPHAPGTPDHDGVEMNVYADVLRGLPAGAGRRNGCSEIAPPAVYASKGALGHGLGAAGLVSLVIAALSARTRRLPPMPWIDAPLACAIPIGSGAASLAAAGTHAVFAAGFAGHVAGAVITRR